MVEKRKRSFQSWWRSLDKFELFEKLIGLFLLALFVVFVTWLIHDGRMQEYATCDYFASRDLEDIPARCLAYFSGTGQ